MTRLDDIARAMQPSTRIVWIETPSNPLLQCVDIGAVAELAHRAGARAVADNTFASPALQRPLELGCDLVMHATTKYLGGRSDVMGGAVVTRADDEAFAAGAHGAAVRRRGAVAVRLLAGDAQPADAGLPHARALRQRRAGRDLPARPSEGLGGPLSRASQATRSTPSRSGRCRTSAACCRSRRSGGKDAAMSGRRARRGLHARDQPRRRREPDRAPRLDRGPREPDAAGPAARLGRPRARRRPDRRPGASA